jgi:kynureninase
MNNLTFDTGRAYAAYRDTQDELSAFRSEFVIDDPDLIYLDGNSLGRLPAATIGYLQTTIREEWGSGLVRSWNQGWSEAPRRVGKMVSSLIGAAPDEVVVCDSTTTNLYKLSLAALSLQQGRRELLSDVLNFPTDLYILQGVQHLLGGQHILRLLPSQDGIVIPTQHVLDAITQNTALVSLSYPTFKSGYLYDIETITRHAHQVGALVLWDFCHGVGVVPIELERWGVDFAVGCTYKYLNGGPGSPAFLYVRRDLQNRVIQPLTGWWGHQAPFAFDLDYKPAQGINRFLVGSPPILSLVAIEPSLEMTQRAGITRIRQKSIQLTSYLVDLFDAYLAPLGFTLGSPRQPQQRGSHVSVSHPESYRITRALIEEMKVVPDFRQPDTLRLGLAPLYTTFCETWDAVQRIRQVVVEERYKKYSEERLPVT